MRVRSLLAVTRIVSVDIELDRMPGKSAPIHLRRHDEVCAGAPIGQRLG